MIHPAVGGMAVSVVAVTTPATVAAVVISRSHTEPERADLNTGASRIHAPVNLSRGRHRRNQQRAGRQANTRVLMIHSSLLHCCFNASGRGCRCVRKKILSLWNSGIFLLAQFPFLLPHFRPLRLRALCHSPAPNQPRWR